MKEIVEALFILVAALTIMLFFGPIIVILSVVGRLQIGSVKIDLSEVKWAGRVLVGIIGMIVWLAVYIPLILLASRTLIGPLPISFTSVTPAITPTLVITPGITPTLTFVLQPSPTPLSPLASLTGIYTGTFSTNSTKFGGTYTMTLIILENGTGMLEVPGAPFYEDNTVSIQVLDESTVLVVFDDKEGDRIEARLVRENSRLRGIWRYATGNPQHTATGEISVKKVE